jgi:Protein of unknown function (DUF1549)/Protein of unknown function (DUF1553)
VEPAAMFKLFSLRALGGLALAALVGLPAVDLSEASAQKKKAAYDPTRKRAPAAKGTIAAGKKLTAVELARHIDRAIADKLKAEKVEASPRCSDEEFLRRVYLDITGKIPTAAKAAEFLDSKDSDKRAKLIDELLDSKDYGRHMADIWQALLLPRNADNLRLRQYYPSMTRWLEKELNDGTGWDKIVKNILTATGEVTADKTGPAVYWIANLQADKATDNVTRMFLGVQLQCAQCHNHPFTDYKQAEYWETAAFFLKVRPDGNPKAAAKQGRAVKIVEGKQIVANRRRLPESAKILPPKFLGGERPKVKDGEPLRPLLANWLATEKNPYFSRAMANRLWSQFFGRGIVMPVDDMHDGNVATHPELLADLAGQFAASGFDVKYLIRAICNSDTYQRSSKPYKGNEDHPAELYARQTVRPLTPEQLYDSLTMLVGAPGNRGPRAKQNPRGQGNAREQFINFFSAEDGADVTEYQAGIPQVLRLMNAPQLNNAAVLQPLIRGGKGQAEVVEKLYLTVLARRPTAEEKEMVAKFLKKDTEPRSGYAGVLWVLMQSSEFALNR